MRVLITTASWEDRFVLGCKKLVEGSDISSAIVFYYQEYERQTLEARKTLGSYSANIDMEFVSLSFNDTAASWKAANSTLEKVSSNSSILLDISTMPRELIWQVLSTVDHFSDVKIVYHQPESYGEWQSKEPGRPRVVYHLGGISKLGAPTCMLISAGYDLERVIQLMLHYEPVRTVLCVQSGDAYKNEESRLEYARICKEMTGFDIQRVEINAFATDSGLADMRTALASLEPDSHNILLCSLGPKSASVALYLLHRQFEHTSLVYAPSNSFNIDYSQGLSKTIVFPLSKREGL